MHAGAVVVGGDKRRTLVEVAVVVLLLWVPLLWRAVALYMAPPRYGIELVDWVRQLIASVGAVAVLAYLMGSSQGGFAHFGIRRVRAMHVAVFAGAFVVAFLLQFALSYVLNALHPYRPDQMHEFWPPVAGVPMAVVVAATTELLLRGYLVTRFIDLWESPIPAVVLAPLMGGLTQFCYGPYRMAAALVYGLVFGAVFVRWKSVWPVVGAHAALSLLGALAHWWQYHLIQ